MARIFAIGRAEVEPLARRRRRTDRCWGEGGAPDEVEGDECHTNARVPIDVRSRITFSDFMSDGMRPVPVCFDEEMPWPSAIPVRR